MDENYEFNILRDSVFCVLNLMGYNPFDHSVKSMVKISITLVCHHLVTLLLLLEVILNFQGFTTIDKCTKRLPFLLMIGVKMWMAISKREIFKQLLTDSNISMTIYYNEEIFQLRNKIEELIRKIYFAYLVYMLFIAILWTVGGVIEGKLFILTYKEYEMSKFLWAVTYVIDSTFLISTCFITSGLNGIFLFMVIHITTEMKMLNKALTESAINIQEIGFNKILQYHIHLLSLVKRMINIYALVLLVEYSLNWGLLTFNMFLWTMDGFPPDFQHTFEYGLTGFYAAAELFYYSYSGDVIKEEYAKLGDAIFHEFTESFSFEKDETSAVMMIQRSQRNITLTVGGYMDLNLKTFNQAVANCVSAVTFLNTIRANNEGA